MRRFALLTVSLVILTQRVVMGATTAPPSDKKAPDTRLAQLVSIECKDVRVHTVISRLSQMTGVVMAAGSDNNDWRSRDIPIVVRVKDIPLGRLLYAIADAAHLHLARFQKGDDKPYYRMYRTTRRQGEIEAYADVRQEAAVAAGEWDWELWKHLKDLPNREPDTGPINYGGQSLRDPALRGISEVIAALSPEDRDKVLAGDQLEFTYRGASDLLRKGLEKCFRGSWADHTEISASSGVTVPELTQEAIQRSRFLINLNGLQSSDDRDPGLHIQTFVAIPGATDSSYLVGGSTTSHLYKGLCERGYDLSPRPEPPDQPGMATMNASYSRVDLEVASDLPVINAKVKLEAPKDKKHLQFADALLAISKAASFNLVVEDFESHGPTVNYALTNCVGEELEAGSLLRVAAPSSVVWSFDKKNNMLTGQAKEWVVRHTNLIPERTITTLAAKLNGAGVGLDDLEPLADLTQAQIGEWVLPCEDLKPLGRNAARFSLWKAYYALSSGDKTKAKSNQGLLLGEGSLSMINQAIRQIKSDDSEEVTRARIRGQTVGMLQNKDPLVFTTKHSYLLEMDVVIDGKVSTRTEFLSGDPIYSPKREQELAKATPRVSNK